MFFVTTYKLAGTARLDANIDASIAKKKGLTVAELRELNDLAKNATVRIGQKLRVEAPRTLSAGF